MFFQIHICVASVALQNWNSRKPLKRVLEVCEIPEPHNTERTTKSVVRIKWLATFNESSCEIQLFAVPDNTRNLLGINVVLLHAQVIRQVCRRNSSIQILLARGFFLDQICVAQLVLYVIQDVLVAKRRNRFILLQLRLLLGKFLVTFC